MFRSKDRGAPDRADPAGEGWRPTPTQRRDHVRVRSRLSVAILTEAGELEYETLDLSAGGFRAPIYEGFDVGDVVAFRMALPGDAEISGLARVARRDERTRSCGLEFRALGRSDRDLIAAHVAGEQRRALANGTLRPDDLPTLVEVRDP